MNSRVLEGLNAIQDHSVEDGSSTMIGQRFIVRVTLLRCRSFNAHSLPSIMFDEIQGVTEEDIGDVFGSDSSELDDESVLSIDTRDESTESTLFETSSSDYETESTSSTDSAFIDE